MSENPVFLRKIHIYRGKCHQKLLVDVISIGYPLLKMLGRSTEKYIFILAIFAAFLVVLSPFLNALMLALLLTAVLSESVRWLEKKTKLKRKASSFLISLAFSLGVIVPLALLLVFVGRELLDATRSIEAFFRERDWSLSSYFDHLREKFGFPDFQFSEKWLSGLGKIGEAAAKYAGQLAGSIPQHTLELVVFILALYYFLVSHQKLKKLFQDLLPLDSGEFKEFSVATKMIFRGVMLGSLVSGLVQGTIIGLGFWIFDIPNPILFGSLTAFLSLVPLLGTGPTGLGGTLYLLVGGHVGAAMGMLFFFALAAVSENIIKPWVLNGASELHPLLALLGALGGIAFFGFTGLFLGPLIMALAVIAVKLYVDSKKDKRFSAPAKK